MKWHQTHCVICGYDFKCEIRDVDGRDYAASICPACFAEAGLDDEDLETVRTYRKHWIEKGCPWTSDRRMPTVAWDPQALLKTIPEEWQ